MAQAILVLNAGSSSLKFSVYKVEAGDDMTLDSKGQVEGIGTRPRFLAKSAAGEQLAEETYGTDAVAGHPEALERLAAWVIDRLGDTELVAVGHRVVHGGPDYAQPVLIDDAVLQGLEAFVPLAPLHQPHNLAAIRAVRAHRPELPQVACFDTAFHRGHPEVADRFALPDSLYQEGVRRYGFHGLSYEYIARTLPKVAPELAEGRVVVAHLGSGASMCAIQAGRSIDSTMGFTALDGLPMGTRPGAIDPGVLLYLLTVKGWDPDELQRFLYHDAGLRGLSGVSNDVRDLEASDDPMAAFALEYFVHRIARELGALSASLEGLDALVFTAGIGENAPEIRAQVCAKARWLGIEIDAAANEDGTTKISTAGSRVAVLVIPTDEERMIALHTLDAVGQKSQVSAA